MPDENLIKETKVHKEEIKFFCLLCRRKFKFEATLVKHNQFSEMHKVSF